MLRRENKKNCYERRCLWQITQNDINEMYFRWILTPIRFRTQYTHMGLFKYW